jgi:hypothetical protein
MAAPKKRALDIFDVLKNIDLKNYGFYDNLSEEQQKAYVPLVLMRWLSGTKDARQIVFLNELVNPGVFRVTNHKGLMHRLMCVSTSGASKRYNWMKANQKKGGSTPTLIKAVRQYYGYNSREAYDALSLLDNDDLLEIIYALGYQKDEIAKAKKELRTR